MRLVIVAVGTRMPEWADEAFSDYAKRMPRELRLELVELRTEPREGGKPTQALLAAEARRIEAAVPRDALRVALDEHGRELTTVAFAAWLRERSSEGRDIAFLVGGPDGLASGLKEQAGLRLRLSAMTLPHALARVVLAEQLYRCACVLRNHPYHRE
ncbi:MAG: 23S rRNA (pseudouridine(1915)-N(3))-methyltransferase RlmH [Betaproteobacteria bacterium RIFCSPLOWO2_02_FULL_65_24]|nr:MAG: 23S rRNA (pseudouridine(1915)-N(3))-methyltransferase RlmH [Betaproteobacteria bacterium RIFCSPLOWO2_02_FULL_65_24]